MNHWMGMYNNISMRLDKVYLQRRVRTGMNICIEALGNIQASYDLFLIKVIYRQ
jgi:hypothetical protein